MRAGRFEEAWTIGDAVQRTRDPAARDDPSLPYHLRWVWDGRPFEGRDVLVRCYHGLGDTLQFARYLPRLADRAATVTVEAPPTLIELLATLPMVARLRPFDPARPLPPAECDIEITELAHTLRVGPSGRPSYLHASPAPLPSGTIGICHAAGPWDPDRSLPADLLADICIDHDVVTLVAEPSKLPVINPEGCPFDMAATAALVAGCGLVITVDTMIAHLAGALGRPTWLMLKSDPDWRWPAEGTTTPWYPSMRVYHQPRAGDWATVVDAARRDLDRFLPAAAQSEASHDESPHPLGADLLG